MSIINKIGWPILVEAAVRLVKYVTDKVYEYKKKKLEIENQNEDTKKESDSN